MTGRTLGPRNHYETLGVAPDAPPEVVRAAYLALVKRYHPDGMAPDAERIRQINEAWRVLGRPSRRAEYDEHLAVTDVPTPEEPERFSHGTAGWGVDATMPVEDVDDPEVAGAPGWGEGDDAGGAAPGAFDPAPGAAPPVGPLSLVLVLVLAGVTWFGVARVDAGWALAACAAGVAAGWVAWRWSVGLAYLPMVGAWACAVAAVVDARDLLRWRGWEDIGSWVGGWLTALLWLGGVAFVTLMLIGAVADAPPSADDWPDAG